MRREGVIGAEQIKVMVPMKPCLTSKICAVGLELPVLYKQRLHVADGGGLVAVVIEKARQQWRKCSQHLTKRRRGNVPLKPWPIPPGAESVSDTVSITDRREVLKHNRQTGGLEVLLAGAGSTPIGSAGQARRGNGHIPGHLGVAPGRDRPRAPLVHTRV